MSINNTLEVNQSNSIYLVSQKNISQGFIDTLNSKIPHQKFNYLDRDQLLKLIDENYSDFWKHNDQTLIDYEKHYCIVTQEETDIKKLKIFNDKYQKLLDIFIEPRIYYTYEEPKTQTPVRKKIDINYLINDPKNQLISGDAGTGKTTLLKKIGEHYINSNSEGRKKKIPIFISATEIFQSNFKIIDVLKKKVI